MKDISAILQKAILISNGYSARHMASIIEKIPKIWCRLEDDSNLNWYLISKSNGKSIEEYYGYLSVKFPIAFLYKECPREICKLLSQNGILQDEYIESCCCNEYILNNYVEGKKYIDDRFLYDSNLPFDEEAFLEIDRGIDYINPYNFNFSDIIYC